jgi:4-amino-4-deoxy-L-arabinose transferase-like glycosyltransferase
VYYLWQLTELLFQNKRVTLFAAFFYTCYPPLFYFIHTIAQETIFLFFLSAFAFHFVRYLQTGKMKDNLLAALFFTMTYLTKSFISLYVPFIVLLMLFHLQHISLTKRIMAVIQFFIIVLVLVIPVGINNNTYYGTFVTSSNGGGLVFFVANSELNYVDLTNTPSGKDKAYEFGKAPKMAFTYFPNPTYDSILKIPVKDKANAFWHAGFKWIKENPAKFFKIRVMNFIRLILPGNSWNRYPFWMWLFSFLSGLPLFLLAYYGITKSMMANWKKHLWIILYILSMSIMHIMFIFTNRYRTFTFDFFYGMYAAYGLDLLLTRYRSAKAIAT